MQPILMIIGTRPEGIKMMPVYLSLKQAGLNVLLCSTTQHRELLSQVFDIFKVKPDFELDVMQSNQDLFYLNSEILTKIKPILLKTMPSVVLVQGDTTTAMAASLASYYLKIPVAHVEAGLRTDDIYSPFPEEANRQIVTVLASYHFVPTAMWVPKLIKQGVAKNKILCTGNTVVDALRIIIEKIEAGQIEVSEKIKNICEQANMISADQHKKIVLFTMHRRESFGQNINLVLSYIKELANKHKNLLFIFPVHLNPNVQNAVKEANLKNHENFIITDSLKYPDMVYLIKNCMGIMTDSGGIQEEGVSLQRPVLILREKTERPEGVAVGVARLVGYDKDKIFKGIEDMLHGRFYLADAQGLYGNGHAADIITNLLSHEFTLNSSEIYLNQEGLG